jgi:hypothetical protein
MIGTPRHRKDAYMTSSLLLFRVVCVVLLLCLILGSLMAQAQDGLWAGLARIMRQPWGVVTLTDLGCGLLAVAGWMCCLERRRGPLAGWLVALFLLGNISTVAFLLLRSLSASSLRQVFLPGNSGT